MQSESSPSTSPSISTPFSQQDRIAYIKSLIYTPTPPQTNKPLMVHGQPAQKANVLAREYSHNVARDLRHATLEIRVLQSEVPRLQELKLWSEYDEFQLEKAVVFLDEALKAMQNLQKSLERN